MRQQFCRLVNRFSLRAFGIYTGNRQTIKQFALATVMCQKRASVLLNPSLSVIRVLAFALNRNLFIITMQYVTQTH
jgi:hypothetical protein